MRIKKLDKKINKWNDFHYSIEQSRLEYEERRSESLAAHILDRVN